MILSVFYIDSEHFKSYVSGLQTAPEIHEEIIIFIPKYVVFSSCFSSSAPGAKKLPY